MSILSLTSHEYWATVSGGSLKSLENQEEALAQWGVTAIEFRADLIPFDVFEKLITRNKWRVPTFVAHFGIGANAKHAEKAILKAITANIHGCICHSRSEILYDLQQACISAGKSFAAAYHSQTPMTLDEALQEFDTQEALNPLFRKIAVRALRFEDALAIIEATQRASAQGKTPAVGAIFGSHRWARIVLPHVGSAITFIIAHKVFNEEGGDDEQLQISEVDNLQKFRLLPVNA
jgi:hypothetical protein